MFELRVMAWALVAMNVFFWGVVFLDRLFK